MNKFELDVQSKTDDVADSAIGLLFHLVSLQPCSSLLLSYKLSVLNLILLIAV